MLDAKTAENYRKHLTPIAGSKPLLLLELGAGDGRQAEWWLENLLYGLTDRYLGLDRHWENSPGVEAAARKRLSKYNGKAVLATWAQLDCNTAELWAILHGFGGPDIVHLLPSRDHTASQIHEDLLATWQLLRVGGVLIQSGYRPRGRRHRSLVVQDTLDEFFRTHTSHPAAGCALDNRAPEILAMNHQAIIRKKE